MQICARECSLLWHPHTLTNDYGWEQGFKKYSFSLLHCDGFDINHKKSQWNSLTQITLTKQ